MRKRKKKYVVRDNTSYKKVGIMKRKTLKKKEKIEYLGLPCDSYSEKYTLYWLEELEGIGMIKPVSIKRAPSHLLFDTVSKNWIERLKTKSNPRVESILAAHLYTADFIFELTDKGKACKLFSDIEGTERLRARGKYNLIHQNGRVYIETKGTSFRTSSDTVEKFTVDQKWMWEKHKIYVNLFQPDKVFSLTFTPRNYLVTDITKQQRKIKWKQRNLFTYLKSI